MSLYPSTLPYPHSPGLKKKQYKPMHTNNPEVGQIPSARGKKLHLQENINRGGGGSVWRRGEVKQEPCARNRKRNKKRRSWNINPKPQSGVQRGRTMKEVQHHAKPPSLGT